MTYILETIGEAGMLKIQRDLDSQQAYCSRQASRFVSRGANAPWGIDCTRNLYLHRIQFIASSDEVAYHFFSDGRSVLFTIPDNQFDGSFEIDFFEPQEDVQILIDQIQEAFDTYGRSGRGPDVDEFSRVVLVRRFGEKRA